jgi:hypothetical protein
MGEPATGRVTIAEIKRERCSEAGPPRSELPIRRAARVLVEAFWRRGKLIAGTLRPCDMAMSIGPKRAA